ncbi:MAG: hypothetical protein Q7S13_03045, partial [Candidatus Omnitrophota bacterium]|nr:hypothetical protein [Candidatus Omnitrophota bacterium]
ANGDILTLSPQTFLLTNKDGKKVQYSSGDPSIVIEGGIALDLKIGYVKVPVDMYHNVIIAANGTTYLPIIEKIANQSKEPSYVVIFADGPNELTSDDTYLPEGRKAEIKIVLKTLGNSPEKIQNTWTNYVTTDTWEKFIIRKDESPRMREYYKLPASSKEKDSVEACGGLRQFFLLIPGAYYGSFTGDEGDNTDFAAQILNSNPCITATVIPNPETSILSDVSCIEQSAQWYKEKLKSIIAQSGQDYCTINVLGTSAGGVIASYLAGIIDSDDLGNCSLNIFASDPPINGWFDYPGIVTPAHLVATVTSAGLFDLTAGGFTFAPPCELMEIAAVDPKKPETQIKFPPVKTGVTLNQYFLFDNPGNNSLGAKVKINVKINNYPGAEHGTLVTYLAEDIVGFDPPLWPLIEDYKCCTTPPGNGQSGPGGAPGNDTGAGSNGKTSS